MSTFCFIHEDNYDKPHYKLLTPCVYLRLTLYVVKNGKNRIFSVLGCWCMTPISTRFMDRWECVLCTVKYGSWSGASGVGPAKPIEGTLDSAGYHGILARHVVPEVR